MKTAAVVVTLAIAGVTICTSLAPAFASKMDGRCCQWSDGGRSFRYRFATMRSEFPYLLRTHAVSCINQSWNRMDAMRTCLASGPRAAPIIGRPSTATNGI
jgi:hypothetical protein